MAVSIVHDIPGRLRLRLGRALPGIDDEVRRERGVTGCTWSPGTRSLLVRYDEGQTTAGAIVEAVAARVSGEAPATASAATAARAPELGRAVARTMAEANAAVGRLSGGFIDLRTLLPLALAGWAVRELMLGRAGPLAWSTALWYSHGLFRDYNLPPDHS